TNQPNAAAATSATAATAAQRQRRRLRLPVPAPVSPTSITCRDLAVVRGRSTSWSTRTLPRRPRVVTAELRPARPARGPAHEPGGATAGTGDGDVDSAVAGRLYCRS